jgi:hypothetical protein
MDSDVSESAAFPPEDGVPNKICRARVFDLRARRCAKTSASELKRAALQAFTTLQSANWVYREKKAVRLAAAAIAFAALLLVAAPTAVGQPVLPASAWAGFQSCPRWLPPMEHRISAEPTMQDFAPTATLTPIQSKQPISPIPAPSMTIPVVAASEEPDQPWWQFALQYGALMTTACLVAWRVGISIRRFEPGTNKPNTTNVDARRDFNGDATGPGDGG